MRFSSTNLDSLRSLYVDQLRTLLSAERQIADSFPEMTCRATGEDLRNALQRHLGETLEHARRIEQILRELTGECEARYSKPVSALLGEANDMTREISDVSVRDAALIAAMQRVEHYEIAAYASLRHFARILGETTHAQLLDRTIREEGHADYLLSDLQHEVHASVRRAA